MSAFRAFLSHGKYAFSFRSVFPAPWAHITYHCRRGKRILVSFLRVNFPRHDVAVRKDENQFLSAKAPSKYVRIESGSRLQL